MTFTKAKCNHSNLEHFSIQVRLNFNPVRRRRS